MVSFRNTWKASVAGAVGWGEVRMEGGGEKLKAVVEIGRSLCSLVLFLMTLRQREDGNRWRAELCGRTRSRASCGTG